MSSYVSVVCRLLAAAYHAILRNRAVIVSGIMAVIGVITKGALYMYVPPKKMEPLLRTLGGAAPHPTPPAIELPPQPEKSVHCDVLHDPGPNNRQMDVIFIHGLKGSLERTWTQGMWELKGRDNGGRILLRKSSSASSINTLQISEVHRQSSESNLATVCKNVDCNGHSDGKVVSQIDQRERDREVSRCWPRDWLPQDCPGARVIALNYTTDPYLWRPVWINKRCRTSMSERAWEMMHHLSELGVGEHPIVWVGHSKGGLFVKQMLVHEYTDMILIYGKVNKNGLAAVQEYRDTFPHRRTPDRKTFEAVERRLRETGSFKPKRIDTGRQRSARNYNNEQAIINAVELSPTTSTRRLSLKWPPRSPDLTPADFFLWGWMKSIVYSKRINTIEELRNRITEAAETIKNAPNVMKRARKE
ncbi:hypothetical protein J6590_065895 [Homalodisca vitripennis]|nr:hypothetical protein J6590_065895 [Homalodisca vitripennis]